MCVYSRVSEWGKEITFPQPSPIFPSFPNTQTWPSTGTSVGFPWTDDSWAEYQELLKRAAEVDAMLDQADCQDTDKTAWMADVEATLATQREDDVTDDTDSGVQYSANRSASAANYDDANGNPAGGWVDGTGIVIDWQNGPLGRGADRKKPNGAFVEDVLWAVIQRIEYYQDSEFACRENALALTKCEEALHWLNSRTAKREAREVEGTHAA